MGKMVFSEYMNSLPNMKVDMIHKISQECLVSEMSVYRWISGSAKPDALKRKTISKVLGIPENDLFPEDN
jgi:transcriptional regulator with XRE-family HTH domain